MSRGEASDPVQVLLKLLSGPWTMIIVWQLCNHKTIRFSEIKKLIPGISARMLTERLRLLEQNGLVERTYKPTIPPEVAYELTEKGSELRPALDVLNTVAERWDEGSTPSAGKAVTGIAYRKEPAPRQEPTPHAPAPKVLVEHADIPASRAPDVPAEAMKDDMVPNAPRPIVIELTPEELIPPFKPYSPPQMDRQAVISTKQGEEVEAAGHEAAE